MYLEALLTAVDVGWGERYLYSTFDVVPSETKTEYVGVVIKRCILLAHKLKVRMR